MCVFVCVCTRAHACAHSCILARVSVCRFVYVRTSVCIYVQVRACVCTRVHVRVCMCKYEFKREGRESKPSSGVPGARCALLMGNALHIDASLSNTSKKPTCRTHLCQSQLPTCGSIYSGAISRAAQRKASVKGRLSRSLLLLPQLV